METIDENWRFCRVSMNLRWFNRNAVGVHFGGSLYSMVDPHYMLLIMKSLGKEYTVWDKSAAVNFIKPGKGYVWAEFRVTDQMLEDIKHNTANGQPYTPSYTVEIKDEVDNLICRVEKTLYIKETPQSGVRI